MTFGIWIGINGIAWENIIRLCLEFFAFFLRGKDQHIQYNWPRSIFSIKYIHSRNNFLMWVCVTLLLSFSIWFKSKPVRNENDMRTLNSTHIFQKRRTLKKKMKEYSIKADVAKQRDQKKERDHKQFSGQIVYRQYNSIWIVSLLFPYPFPYTDFSYILHSI